MLLLLRKRSMIVKKLKPEQKTPRSFTQEEFDRLIRIVKKLQT